MRMTREVKERDPWRVQPFSVLNHQFSWTRGYVPVCLSSTHLMFSTACQLEATVLSVTHLGIRLREARVVAEYLWWRLYSLSEGLSMEVDVAGLFLRSKRY